MKWMANGAYCCTRPKKLKSGLHSIRVTQLLEMPSEVEWRAWNSVLENIPPLCVAYGPKRAIRGCVTYWSPTRVNRMQWKIEYEVTGEIVFRVSKGAQKSTASDQG